jgi:DNA polymerase-3 subunit alpha
MGDQSTIPKLKLQDAPPATQSEKLLWEKELLGLYISGHPLDKFKDKLASRGTNIKTIKERGREGVTVVAAGIIEEMKEFITKKGDPMLFMKIADFSDSSEVVVFPKVLTEFKTALFPENCIVIKGKISKRNGTVGIIAEKIKTL